MAAELREAHGADVRLVKGAGGVFNVVVDGRRVFSKSEAGRFPEAGEIAALLERAKG